jgi:hypothetical protein
LEPPAQGEEINQFRSGQQALVTNTAKSFFENPQHEIVTSIFKGSRKLHSNADYFENFAYPIANQSTT